MYLKLTLALCAISLSLYGRQAESMSPPPEIPAPVSSPEIPALKPIQGVYIDWKERVIHAVGTGQGTEGADPSVRHLLAMRAARADALRKLAAVVFGMHIDRETTVDEHLPPTEPKQQKLRIKVEGLIKGAKEAAEPEIFPDGTCRIHLILPLDSIEGTLSLKEPLPKQ